MMQNAKSQEYARESLIADHFGEPASGLLTMVAQAMGGAIILASGLLIIAVGVTAVVTFSAVLLLAAVVVGILLLGLWMTGCLAESVGPEIVKSEESARETLIPEGFDYADGGPN